MPSVVQLITAAESTSGVREKAVFSLIFFAALFA